MVAPSLLSANFADLKSDLEKINQSEADWLHLDIMDGVFVAQYFFWFSCIKNMWRNLNSETAGCTSDDCTAGEIYSGGEEIGSHDDECTMRHCPHQHRVISRLRKREEGRVTLNPATPVSVLEDIITEVDMVLLMSVNPDSVVRNLFLIHLKD